MNKVNNKTNNGTNPQKKKKNKKSKKNPKVAASNGGKKTVKPPSTQGSQGRKINSYSVKGNPVLTLAQGVRSNIMENVPIDAQAVEFFFLPMITNALVMGYENNSLTPAYWAFIAALTDFINVLTSEVNFVSSRLHYLNEILGAYRPKTIPFKSGTIQYLWQNVLAANLSSAYALRGYKYAMYTDQGTSNTVWTFQLPPGNPTTPGDTLPVYAKLIGQIGNCRQPHLAVVPLDDKKKYVGAWDSDASPFSQCSVYYGRGNTASADGPSYSAELEVPKKSTILTGMTSFSPANGRVARVFSLSSGGSACATGLAFLPKWAMELYNTAYPVQYCFLDLDEVVCWLQSWYLGLVLKAATDDPNRVNALSPFSYTPQQFRIAVRQVICAFFANSQAAGQFLTYSSQPLGFEPFRQGSNCYGQNRQSMLMPELLVENLRMLLPAYVDVPTKFHNDKNQLIFVPVWGIQKAVINSPLNLTGSLWTGSEAGYTETVLFNGLDPNNLDPNPIDGFDSSGNCCDLNGKIITDLIAEWNLRVNDIKTASLPTTYLTGSARATLLTYTRFNQYVDRQVEISDFTPYMRALVPRDCVAIVEEEVPLREKTSRSVSKEGTVKRVKKMMYVPPNGSLFEQDTLSFSSVGLITQEAIELFNYFIFPTVTIEPTLPPSQKQVRSAGVQSYIYDLASENNGIFNSRGYKLREMGKLCAPGIAAAETDELANVVKEFANQVKGGFIGDLVGGLATILIPF